MVLLRMLAAASTALLFSCVTVAGAIEIHIEKAPLRTNAVVSIDDLLEPIRKKYKLPALAAAVCSSTDLLAQGAVGLRKAGSSEPVEVTDKFHLGSCTKSMTALLAAIMVERGQIHWSNTVRDLFPDREYEDEIGAITLEQLLTHRSGIAYGVSRKLWAKAFAASGPPKKQRDRFLEEALQEDLAAKPGTKYIYSNTGYALAGNMLEHRAGKPWEDLIRQELFTPLQMSSAGFGPPSISGEVDQPWGHSIKKNEPQPQPPGDNPPAIAPAGTAHCSITDLARYASFHLAAAQGKIPWISKETLRKLYQPAADQEYALGWVVLDRSWAGGKALTHAGSNTVFFALIWMAPEKDIAFVVCTNASSREENDPAAEGADKAVGNLIEKFLKPAS